MLRTRRTSLIGTAHGAGIVNAGTLTITKSTITGNEDGILGAGGGIANGGTLLINDSAITDNGAGGTAGGDGGGILNSTGGTAIIANSTIAHNSAGGSGGGIANGGTLTLTNSTIAANHVFSGVGGGIVTGDGRVVLLNTILALNTAEIPPPFRSPDCSGRLTSLDNNLIGDLTNCTITLQSSDLTGDPGLDAFTDDATPGNGHFPLLPTSQAIDAGNTAVCPSTDQLGQRRIGRCDIGAIRFLDNIDLQQENDATAATQATK